MSRDFRAGVSTLPAIMLTCRICGVTSTGAAWHWIALLIPTRDGRTDAVACYCPICAESRFKYFSTHRERRASRTLFHDDDLDLD